MTSKEKSSKFLEILIAEPSQQGNMGILLIDGFCFCWTMMRDYTDKVYAIPEGLFPYEEYDSPTYGKTYQVIVEGRTYLLFHLLNTEEGSEGCIGLGEYPGEIGGKRAVMNSGNTVKKFLRFMHGVKGGWIRIRRVY